MIEVAAVSGALSRLGVVAVACLAAAALVDREPRRRAVAILGALVLAPALLLGSIWRSPQLGVVHRHPLFAFVGALAAVIAVGALAVAIARRPALFAPLMVIALPFRVPIESGGITNNLLVPLYAVVAAGSLALALPALQGRRGAAPRQSEPGAPPARRGVASARPSVASAWRDVRRLQQLLALYLVLYALQATYSPGLGKQALQNVVFFYVPFALMFCVLLRLVWTPQLLRACLMLLAALAVLFALVGFVEYATKTLLLNPKLIAANDVHAYFVINSVFFDPDIFGRFLALAMILLASGLLYGRRGREQLITGGVLAVLWGALVLTLSRSSLAALLVGLGMLAALRWNASRTVVVTVAVVAVGAAAVAASPTTFGLNQGANGASAGRAGLVSSGATMFGRRPLWGYGSGSFVDEYRKLHPATSQTLAASHTIPVTIAGEQGLIGELAYLGLLFAAALVLLRRVRSDHARTAIAAAFVALVFHTLLDADFLEDPDTGALLGIGAAPALAARAPAGQRR
ncbi:MAG: O-antigen ligase family protein, partial [Solirubrobacteraceae bacterium]